MSFALETAFKVSIITLTTAAVVVFMVTCGVFINDALSATANLGIGDLSSYLATGRELANNFVEPMVFNCAIALWLASIPLLTGLYISNAIYSKLLG